MSADVLVLELRPANVVDLAWWKERKQHREFSEWKRTSGHPATRPDFDGDGAA